ncbi:hypothetical protein D3C86_1483930 [compost metagenome]
MIQGRAVRRDNLELRRRETFAVDHGRDRQAVAADAVGSSEVIALPCDPLPFHVRVGKGGDGCVCGRKRRGKRAGAGVLASGEHGDDHAQHD